ncbi:MAG: MMPL family transporter [Gammaproteobacteria bacterium]|nr:MMPL family transporter [Gammaproteobacteria bacterium]
MSGRWLKPCERLLLARPWHSLLVMLALLLIVGAHIPGLRVDAPVQAPGADAAARAFARGLAGEFGPQDFLVLTYRPLREDLMSELVLERIARLRVELAGVAGVHAVHSLLEVPLLFSPPIRFADIGGDLLHVQDTGVDTDLARAELMQSPLYRRSLLAGDGQQTALRITLEPEAAEALLAGQRRLLDDLHAVLARHRDEATLFLGGAALGTAATPAFVQRDFVRYGAAIPAVMALLLLALWRRPQWAIVPPAAGGACVVLLLGLLGWSARAPGAVPAGAIAVALAAASVMALRLVAACRERLAREPARAPRELVGETLHELLAPLLGGAAVAVVAALALAAGGLAPVASLGVTAALGIGLAALVASVLVPVLLLLAAGGGRQAVASPRALERLAALPARHGIAATLLALALAAGGLAGVQRLQPEDRLLERFGTSTALYRGTLDIDREFGGSDALAIVLESDTPGQAGAGSANPWYSARGLQRLRQVHEYLDVLDGSAGVRSLALFGATAAELLGGTADDGQLAAAWRGMPAARRALLLEPWLSADAPRTLVVVGLNGTGAAPPRDELAGRIRAQLVGEFGFAPEQVRIGGPAPGPGSASQTLLRTQLVAAAAACAVLALLVLARFRSPLLALLALAPSLCTAAVAVGAPGWLGVPLGPFTAAFAALAVASCAAGTLHALWRVAAALRAGADHASALQRSGAAAALCYIPPGIGAAFALLMASDFRPSADLGLLCAVALTAAAGFTALLLPPLLLWFRLPARRSAPGREDGFDPANA